MKQVTDERGNDGPWTCLTAVAFTGAGRVNGQVDLSVAIGTVERQIASVLADSPDRHRFV